MIMSLGSIGMRCCLNRFSMICMGKIGLNVLKSPIHTNAVQHCHNIRTACNTVLALCNFAQISLKFCVMSHDAFTILCEAHMSLMTSCKAIAVCTPLQHLSFQICRKLIEMLKIMQNCARIIQNHASIA